MPRDVPACDVTPQRPEVPQDIGPSKCGQGPLRGCASNPVGAVAGKEIRRGIATRRHAVLDSRSVMILT